MFSFMVILCDKNKMYFYEEFEIEGGLNYLQMEIHIKIVILLVLKDNEEIQDS